MFSFSDLGSKAVKWSWGKFRGKKESWGLLLTAFFSPSFPTSWFSVPPSQTDGSSNPSAGAALLQLPPVWWHWWCAGTCTAALGHGNEGGSSAVVHRNRGCTNSPLGGGGKSLLTAATLVSVRTTCSRGGRYAEPQITVVIFHDGSALEASVLCLSPFHSTSLSGPSQPADGQLGAARCHSECPIVLSQSQCSHCPVKEGVQIQHAGTQFYLHIYVIRTNGLLRFQKHSAGEPNRVASSTEKDRLRCVPCFLGCWKKLYGSQ